MGELVTDNDSASVATTLPPEVLDLIFDVSDAGSLAQFGLVSKMWLQMTRYRIFSALELYNRNSTSRFIMLLTSSLSTIRELVTQLYIKADIGTIEQIAPYIWKMSNVIFLTVIPLGSFVRPLGQAAQSGLKLFSNITHLDIRFDFEKFEELTDFICSFPEVEKMVVASDWSSPSAFGYANTSRPPASLRFLTLHTYHEYMMDWLLSLKPIPVIPNLALHNITLEKNSLKAVQKYLQILKHDLCELEVSFDAPYVHSFSMDSIDMLLDFSTNTEMRSLTIAITEIPPCLERAFAKRLLSTIASKELREITLDEVTIHEDPESSRDWFEVDEILSTLLSSTSKLRIVADCEPEVVACAFPQCAQLGLLHICMVHIAGETEKGVHVRRF